MGQTNLCDIGPLHAAQTGFSCLGVVLLIVEWIHWFVELTSGLHRAHGAKSTLLGDTIAHVVVQQPCHTSLQL